MFIARPFESEKVRQILWPCLRTKRTVEHDCKSDASCSNDHDLESQLKPVRRFRDDIRIQFWKDVISERLSCKI